MQYRILLTGGGSSGHVTPLVAVAEELQQQATQKGVDLELRFIGDNEVFKEISGGSIKSVSILSPKWRRYSSIQNFIDILKFPVGFFQSLFYVWLYMPDVIFSKGGFDSFLPSLAGKIFMIPLTIHDSDAIPGKANLWLGRMANKVFISFESAGKYFKSGKTELVGNPVRKGLLNVADKSSALSSFSLDPAKPTVLITGASQGAQIINDVLLLSLVELTKKFQVIHQCGRNNYDEVNKQILSIVKEGETTYGPIISKNYRLYPVFDLQQMVLAYSAADVVVSRGGAAAISEIAILGKPAIIIPLAGSASNHQLANAKELTKFGAIMIEESNLTPHILVNEIGVAYQNRATISEKIKQFAKPEAAKVIAGQLLSMIGAA